ncbi:MAG: hypothetical protein NXI30_20715 [bacterium]|nr:hypothetical protein [bacterium]
MNGVHFSERSRVSALLRSLAIVVVASCAIAGPAVAQLLVPIDSVANVSGSITSTVGNWSDAQQSPDLAPNIQVQQVITSLGANSLVSASQNLALDLIRVETGFLARTSGSTSNVAIDHDYTLRFSLTSAATFEFRNGNNTGGFPIAFAPDPGTTASLVYRLEDEGGSVIFSYEAPNVASGVAGVYASGTVPAGTYLFSVVGSAEALGDPCCVFQNAQPRGNVALDFEPAPDPPSVSGLGVIASSFLLVALVVVAAFAGERRRAFSD